jgi:arabinose-5-phosphate isomerase
VKQAIVEITKNRLGAAAVVDDEQMVIGIITDGDIRRMLENHDNIADLTCVDVMTPNPVTVESELLAVDAAKIILDRKISQIVVVKDKHYFGMVHIHDMSSEGIL